MMNSASNMDVDADIELDNNSKSNASGAGFMEKSLEDISAIADAFYSNYPHTPWFRGSWKWPKRKTQHKNTPKNALNQNMN